MTRATMPDAEGFLLRAGLLVRTEQGRQITHEGIEYLRHGTVAAPLACA